VAGGPKSSIYPRLESVGDADEAVAKVIGNLVDDLEPARVMATIWRGVTAVEAPEIFPETSLDDRVAAVIESVLTENSAEIGSLEAATHREVRFDIFYPRFAGKLRCRGRRSEAVGGAALRTRLRLVRAVCVG
jgi:hypothetical protein